MSAITPGLNDNDAERASPTAASPLISARNISVTRRGVAILRDLSFAVRSGGTLGLIGESGAGKSMVARLIANQLPPEFMVSCGSLLFDDEDILAQLPATRRALLGRQIAFVPQEPMSALNPLLRIGQHFDEHFARLGIARDKRSETAKFLLDGVRLPEDVLERYAFQLSGGMCQRVCIALAFASNPRLVVADEPTASLDVTTQIHVLMLLRRLQREHGTAVIFITHDLRLAAQICDELAVLYAGDIVELGPAAAVLNQPLHPYTLALRRAAPPSSGAWRPLIPPSGQMPTIGELSRLSGCRFAARCASADDECSAPVVLRRMKSAGRGLRCIRDDAAPLGEREANVTAATDIAAAQPLLEVEALAKSYERRTGVTGQRTRTLALAAISFRVMPGEFVGIIGESGSGKSTLARLIMGLEQPSSGRVLLNGRPLDSGPAAWKRRIASIQLIFQDPRAALNPRRRIEQLVTQAFGKSLPTAERREQAVALLDRVGLARDFLRRYSREMSGGQRQRVNIARALGAKPQLLIADEIVSGLDVSIQAQILNLLLQLRSDHALALLMISHDLAVVRYLCSRLLVMRSGEIVEQGPTEAVLTTPQHPYTRALISAVPPSVRTGTWPDTSQAQLGCDQL